MYRKSLWLLVGIFFYIHASAYATATPAMDRQEQINQQRQESIERKNSAVERVHLLPQEKVEAIEKQEVKNATKIFIRQIEIDYQGEERKFSFLQKVAKVESNKEFSAEDVNQLLERMNQVLAEHGYTTTKTVLKEQSLKDGILHIALQIGYFGTAIYGRESDKIAWNNAFPIKDGDVYNTFAIEQGVEQLQRLPSQKVSVELLASSNGERTNLGLTVKRKKPIYGAFTLDDAGLKETGKLQLGLTLGIDNLLGKNDLLILGFDLDGAHAGYERGTRGQNIYYAISWGYDTFSISHYRNTYHQTVEMRTRKFVSLGESNTTRFQWNHVLERTEHEKLSLDVGIRRRNSEQYINHIHIPIQDKQLTSLELGLTKEKTIGNAELTARLAHRMGVDWFHAQRESRGESTPKSRYHMWLLDMEYRKSFLLGKRKLLYTGSFHGQWTMGNKRLYATDQIAIAGRYTVRGFDGEYNLSGETGWYIRNEIEEYYKKLEASLYVGLDMGTVYGKSSEDQLGRSLLGATLGLRGKLGKEIGYDVFVAIPLCYPKGFPTHGITTGFKTVWKF